MKHLSFIIAVVVLSNFGCSFDDVELEERMCESGSWCPCGYECASSGYCQQIADFDATVDGSLDSFEPEPEEDIQEGDIGEGDFLPDHAEEEEEAGEVEVIVDIDVEEDEMEIVDSEDQPEPDEYEEEFCIPEMCNGRDDDCDDLVDEEIATIPTTCGEGECLTAGVIVCTGGAWFIDCVPAGSPEICDGLDNDCDDFVDEDFDMDTDPQNCGECNHDCRADEDCIAGRCEPGGMISISASAFLMGDGGNVLASPVHEVVVPTFWIDQHEVTVSAYADCVSQSVCSAPGIAEDCNWQVPDRDNHPINCVSWDAAAAYCEWVGGRLCSEAEWEKAARGLNPWNYPWGNEEATCARAVMKDSQGVNGCGQNTTWSVGSKPTGASLDLVYDLAGNVNEWVEDCWHGSYQNAPADGSAWIENCEAERRLSRGGAFNSGASSLQSFYRIHRAPDVLLSSQGFRCCR